MEVSPYMLGKGGRESIKDDERFICEFMGSPGRKPMRKEK